MLFEVFQVPLSAPDNAGAGVHNRKSPSKMVLEKRLVSLEVLPEMSALSSEHNRELLSPLAFPSALLSPST